MILAAAQNRRKTNMTYSTSHTTRKTNATFTVVMNVAYTAILAAVIFALNTALQGGVADLLNKVIR